MKQFRPQIDLICLEKLVTDWPLGEVIQAPKTVADLAQVLQKQLAVTSADFILFWDADLGQPDPFVILETAQLRGDVWHAGLKFGLGGLPVMLNFVYPNWMLQLDPPLEQESTSWRITLQACLVKTDVIKQLGGPDPEYLTLTGAGLEMGYRYLRHGVFVRYAPGLFSSLASTTELPTPNLYDEMRFIRQYFGGQWVGWAVIRAFLNRRSLSGLRLAYQKLRRAKFNLLYPAYKHQSQESSFDPGEWENKVTVLIPTLERYSYLRVELEQLRHQTVRPLEIMIMDQTPAGERDINLPSEFADLPLRVFYQDTMGQCTGWNQGLLASKGDFILFLGDDADRIAPDFLERFLRSFRMWDADMVACIVDEVGADPVPEHLATMRIADSFPIAMVRRSLFLKSGLMDYAFDHGARADQDLGIRCYLAGGLMIVDPAIRVLHHHAPRGGLRKHKARVVTYSKSRHNLLTRNLAGATEIYLVSRYFTAQQRVEHKWLGILGTFSIRGNWVRKLLKFFVAGILLPNTLWRLWQMEQQAKQLLSNYPQIPYLPISDGQN